MAGKRSANLSLSNDDLSRAIDRWVRGERERAILKRAYIDLIPFEPLAEEQGLSVQWTKELVYRAQEQLFRGLGIK